MFMRTRGHVQRQCGCRPDLRRQPRLPAASRAAAGAPHARAKRGAAGGAGLGYYRRAGYLLDGARHVVERCGGALPATARELQRIPGAASAHSWCGLSAAARGCAPGAAAH